MFYKSSRKIIPHYTDLPLNNSNLSGQEFFYKGKLWHFMTQLDIDSIGWNGIVEVGFVAPYLKILDASILYNNSHTNAYTPSNQTTFLDQNIYHSLNILGFGDPTKLTQINVGSSGHPFVTAKYSQILNANLLTNLNDKGTSPAIDFRYCSLTSQVIDSLFTQLPITNKVATININSNTGSASCTPSIATSKGYIVIT